MLGQANSKADRRIMALESEVRRLRKDVRRGGQRPEIAEDVLVPLAWAATCGLVGIGIAKVVGRFKRRT